jgi:hypothetical protein
MKPLFAFLSLAFFIGTCYAQDQPQDINKKFFELYKLKNSDDAMDYLFSNTSYVENIKEGIDDVKRQLKKQISQIGLYYGADLLSTKTAGPNIVLYTYLVRHAMQPLTFYIMFYKPNDKWQMQSFKFDNSISDDLEEASKLYRSKENFN